MAPAEDEPKILKGVRKIELVSQVITRTDLFFIYTGLILLSFSSSWEGTMGYTLTANVSSILQANNIATILSTVTFILQTILFPAYSKISDIVGRLEMYIFALFFYIISFIIMATANNFATFVGGQIIYTFGYAGVTILAPILIGDLTTVANRGFYQALYFVPGIITNFATGPVGNDLLETNWRWAYGHFPIIVLVSCSPLVYGLWNVQRKATKAGLLTEDEQKRKAERESDERTFFQKVVHVCVLVDLVGSLLMVGGLTMVLLPLVLANNWGGWTAPRTLGTLFGGVACIPLFAIWEWKYAKYPVVPMMDWPNATPIWGVLSTSTVTIVSNLAWFYFNTFLQVSRNIDYLKAFYLGCGYRVGYIVAQVAIGYLMKVTRVWRPYTWGGICLMMLGVGLMIPARQPTSPDAFVVISQLIGGIGSGMMDLPITVAIQSSVPHRDLAMVTSFYQFGGSVAGSIGSTMVGAIWNQMVPREMAKNVPGEYDTFKIMADLEYAKALPEDQYIGVVKSYSQVQRVLTIIAVCFGALALLFTLPMKSFGLSDNGPGNVPKENDEELVNEKEKSEVNETMSEEGKAVKA